MIRQHIYSTNLLTISYLNDDITKIEPIPYLELIIYRQIYT